ncbi:hypothetical protein [Paenibacillus sp. RU5M]|nr:hypothetical protein [Paenibacillus sp. RU5M]
MKTMKKNSFLLTIQLTASPINDNASKKRLPFAQMIVKKQLTWSSG